ncbi:Phage endolysin [Rhodococcus sp. B7740]|nr:Phage endolysin [Rhodococcus sp. B7740]
MGALLMDAQTLRAAMQETYVSAATIAAYLPHFEEAMRAAQITTVLRAAAWCSQIGHESSGLRYMAEIEESNPTWTWDRTRYRGRGPIQLTWQGNYRRFGEWCKAAGYVTDSELFVNRPELVEEPRWGFLAASWYWLNGGPRRGEINAFADAGDILSVSRCVNGWVPTPNGMPDRQSRYTRALKLGDALLPQEDDMAGAAENIEEQLLGRKEVDGQRRGWDQLGDHMQKKRSLVDGVGRVMQIGNFEVEQLKRVELKLDAVLAALKVENPAPYEYEKGK